MTEQIARAELDNFDEKWSSKYPKIAISRRISWSCGFLSDEETRKFWIEHGKACIRIFQYFAEQTGVPCVMSIWTGDGYKDVPADILGPRMRYKESIEEILSVSSLKSL